MEHRAWHDTASKTRRPETSGTDSERERARKRVERKRKFQADVVAYVVINAFLIGISGHSTEPARSGRVECWPDGE
jgi:hypothetical protein